MHTHPKKKKKKLTGKKDIPRKFLINDNLEGKRK